AYRVQDHGPDAVGALHVLVSPDGSRTYRVELDRTKCMKLGRVEDRTLDEARTKAVEVRRLFVQGHNVRADIEQARARASKTLKHCLETWIKIEQHGRKQVKSADATKTFLLSSCKVWWDRPVASLTYADIEELLC